MGESGNEVLTADGLVKVYRVKGRGIVHAVRDVSFSLRSGRILALVGESGSGKSTIGRILCGLEKPTSGSVSLRTAQGGRPRGKIQMVFQDPYAALNPLNSVAYTLARPLVNHRRLNPKEALRAAGDLLGTVRLSPPEEFLSKRPAELSGGQRQRVVIARAIAAGPEVIVADEPVSMLDVSIRADIVDLLDELRRTGRVKAILYITHDLASARRLADEVAVLYRGAVVEYGPPESVALRPLHPYTRLLWSSAPDPRRRFSEEGLETTAAQTGLEIAGHGGAEPGSAAASARESAGARAGGLSPVATGCAFAPRCPLAFSRCLSETPGLRRVGGRLVACHAAEAEGGD